MVSRFWPGFLMSFFCFIFNCMILFCISKFLKRESVFHKEKQKNSPKGGRFGWAIFPRAFVTRRSVSFTTTKRLVPWPAKNFAHKKSGLATAKIASRGLTKKVSSEKRKTPSINLLKKISPYPKPGSQAKGCVPKFESHSLL